MSHAHPKVALPVRLGAGYCIRGARRETMSAISHVGLSHEVVSLRRARERKRVSHVLRQTCLTPLRAGHHTWAACSEADSGRDDGPNIPHRTDASTAFGQEKTPRERGFSSAPERTRTSTDQTVHKALNLARLPIPPQALGRGSIRGAHGCAGIVGAGLRPAVGAFSLLSR